MYDRLCDLCQQFGDRFYGLTITKRKILGDFISLWEWYFLQKLLRFKLCFETFLLWQVWSKQKQGITEPAILNHRQKCSVHDFSPWLTQFFSICQALLLKSKITTRGIPLLSDFCRICVWWSGQIFMVFFLGNLPWSVHRPNLSETECRSMINHFRGSQSWGCTSVLRCNAMVQTCFGCCSSQFSAWLLCLWPDVWSKGSPSSFYRRLDRSPCNFGGPWRMCMAKKLCQKHKSGSGSSTSDKVTSRLPPRTLHDPVTQGIDSSMQARSAPCWLRTITSHLTRWLTKQAFSAPVCTDCWRRTCACQKSVQNSFPGYSLRSRNAIAWPFAVKISSNSRPTSTSWRKSSQQMSPGFLLLIQRPRPTLCSSAQRGSASSKGSEE